ncbi:hypothetical protein FHX05_006077 [Rhizobium sp. BK491]|nr:hypothetical protein [Rhizobium sp. BK491]
MLSPLRAGFVFAKLGANQKGLAAYADLTNTVSSGIGIRPSYAQFQPPYWQVPRRIGRKALIEGAAARLTRTHRNASSTNPNG